MESAGENRRNARRKSTVDLRIAAIAARQHTLVHLRQLRRLGLSDSAVRSRVATGRLHLVHRGVYAVGCALLPREGELLAAVFAAGRGAVLSHLCCAAFHRVHRDPQLIEVSVPGGGGRMQPAFRIHRVRPIHPEDYGRMRGIPCTSLSRTLIDIAPSVGRRGVELAIAEAQHRRIYDRAALAAAADRAAGRRGVAIVRSILDLQGIEHTLTNLELEERFLALMRTAAFPLPLVNQWISVPGGSFKCDFIWHDAKLIVETDGRGAHTRDRQFEEDRRRDSLLKLGGWEVVRFTWRQVVDEPEWVVSIVRRFRQQRKR